MIQALDKTKAPDNVFNLVDLDGARPHIRICPPDSLHHLSQSDVVVAHQIRVDIDLVFLDKTTDGSHLAHTGDCKQRIAHVPVLDRPQLMEVPTSHLVAL